MVEVIARPAAMFFRKYVRSKLRAQICGSCGYTKLIAQEPERLYEAYLESLKR